MLMLSELPLSYFEENRKPVIWNLILSQRSDHGNSI